MSRAEASVGVHVRDVAPLRVRCARTGALLGLVLALSLGAHPGIARAAFDFQSFTGSVINRDGTPDTQAGSHPYALTVSFKVNTVERAGETEITEYLKDVSVNLPTGLAGNPLAVPRCHRALHGIGSCPSDTQVGYLWVLFANGAPPQTMPIYNLVPPPGVPAELGGELVEIKVFMDASIRTGGDYGVTVDTGNIDQRGIVGAQLTLWGVPPDPSHDYQRCQELGSWNSPSEVKCNEGPGADFPTASDVPPVPFLTLPTSCAGPLRTSVRADGWENPDQYVTESVDFSHGLSGEPLEIGGCEAVGFAPRMAVQPETAVADSPTGLNVELAIPQNESPEGLATANLRDAVVELPAGLSISPSAASGLGVCTLVEIALESAQRPSCPPTSKVGSVEIETPLLEHKLEGSVYAAQQSNGGANAPPPDLNPFNSLLALYVVAEGDGVLIKLPGEVTLDEGTGQVTARFGGEDAALRRLLPNLGEHLPQLPFSAFRMHFFGGPRAPLSTPAACGSYGASARLTPWSTPDRASTPPIAPFPMSSGCTAAFAPSLTAGTLVSRAGGFSEFLATFSRRDGEQALKGIQLHTPPGLLGTLTGIPLCAEGQAQAGTCGPQSEIGTVTTAAGPGPEPVWITGGRAYLTGPYRGAPFGLSIVVPAVAGPFDLGHVVVRAAIDIDPDTATLTITSDPLPTILEGVPLQVRTVEVDVNRPRFMLNPTSCAPMTIASTLQGAEGATAEVAAPFQATGCAGLPFKPSFTVSTRGAVSRLDGASLTVTVVQRAGEADIHSVHVDLPKRLPVRLSTLQKACTEGVFEVDPAACPAASAVGVATAHTPVLPVALTGPAYFVSHGSAKFPELVVILQGDGVRIDLHGETFVHSKTGITSSTFPAVPDAPISSFELRLPEGPHSALAAPAGDLCGKRLSMPTTIRGQNGAQVKQSTKILVTGCPRPQRGHRAKRASRIKGKA